MKRSRIKPVSSKRAAENTVRAELRTKMIETRSPKCERCKLNDWTDMHERLSRARGGSITDEAGISLLCRACHRFVTDHPKLATQEGWLKSRWGKHEE